MEQEICSIAGCDQFADAAVAEPQHASTGANPGGSGEAPVTHYSFPWLDGQGRIRMIQAFFCH